MKQSERRAAIYCRISSDPKDRGVGVEDQERDCRRFVASREWRVIEPAYVDNDRSAWNGKHRPAWDRLRADIEAGKVGAVVVYRLARLGRDVEEQEATLRLLRAKDVLLATSDGELQIGNADGRFITRVQGAVNAHESEQISERVRRRMDTVAKNGMPHGGPRPYGFRDGPPKEGSGRKAARTVELDEHEAAVIREAAAALLAGESVRGVCLRLNARGDLSATGKRWQPSGLVRMLLRPRVIGIRSHRATGEHPAAWDAIIEPDDQARLRMIFRDPRRRRHVGAPPRKLLSGVLRCGKCGTRMTSRPEWGSNRRSYACPPPPRGCNGTGVIAEPVEALVTEAVLQLLDTARFDLAQSAEVDTAEQDRARLVELAEMWADGELTREAFTAARTRLDARIAASEQRAVRRIEHEALAAQRAGLRERWPAMSVAEQRIVIDAVIEHIIVQPGRGRTFDPTRVSIRWRA